MRPGQRKVVSNEKGSRRGAGEAIMASPSSLPPCALANFSEAFSRTGSKEVVVAGVYDSSDGDSVEIFSFDLETWRTGEEFNCY